MKSKRTKRKVDNEIAAEYIDSGRYIETPHATGRMKERSIDRFDIYEILRRGKREPKRDEYKEHHKAWNYAFSGETKEGRRLRICVAIDDDMLLVVTAIDLDA